MLKHVNIALHSPEGSQGLTLKGAGDTRVPKSRSRPPPKKVNVEGRLTWDGIPYREGITTVYMYVVPVRHVSCKWENEHLVVNYE